MKAAISWLMSWVLPNPPKMALEKPRDSRWPALRTAHLKKERECQYCGRKSNLQVHHILPVHLRADLELDPDNLITLCEPPGADGCHLRQAHLGSFAKGYNLAIREDCARHRERVRLRETGGLPA